MKQKKKMNDNKDKELDRWEEVKQEEEQKERNLREGGVRKSVKRKK